MSSHANIDVRENNVRAIAYQGWGQHHPLDEESKLELVEKEYSDASLSSSLVSHRASCSSLSSLQQTLDEKPNKITD